MSKLEFKKKQIEENNLLQKSIYLEYLKYAGEYVSSRSFKSTDRFSSLHYQLLFLVSEDTRNKLVNLYSQIIHSNFDNARKLLNEIVPILAEEFNSKYKNNKL